MGLDHSLSSRSLPLLATGRASSDVTNNERAQRSTDPRARARLTLQQCELSYHAALRLHLLRIVLTRLLFKYVLFCRAHFSLKGCVNVTTATQGNYPASER